MAELKPKEFIKDVLIKEIGEIHLEHPYISFALMSVGIEFLGKCINKYDDWNQPSRSEKDFKLAINKLKSFKDYRPLLKKYKLWTSLRNGLLHSFVPKHSITLSSKLETPHLEENSDKTRINLKCENFYNDFKLACEEVIKMDNFDNNKMSMPMFTIPDNPTLNINDINFVNSSGSTFVTFSGKTS